MRPSPAAEPIDFEWFGSHLLEDILPNWLRSAATEEGLFLPRLDRRWRRSAPLDFGELSRAVVRPDGLRRAQSSRGRRSGPEEGTLVSQSRLVYNFSKGYELAGTDEYRAAAEKGARFLLDNFRDRDRGGWSWSCARDGEVVDSTKDSYGHAFVILGLSHAGAVTGEREFIEAAADTWDVLETRFKDAHGGFAWKMTRDFEPLDERRSQNPLMHLFEALLALGDIEGMGAYHERAVEVADFVVGKRGAPAGDGGPVPEYYDLAWNELPASEGGRVFIGHQFEWAFLLSSAAALRRAQDGGTELVEGAAERGLGDSYVRRATELVESGMRLGFDPECGGVFSFASPDGLRRAQSSRESGRNKKGWWEQCEAVRALMHFALVRGRDDFREPLRKTLDFIDRRFLDHEHGGWFAEGQPSDTPPSGRTISGADPRPHGTDKGNMWKVDYHVVGMCAEAMRLGAQLD